MDGIVKYTDAKKFSQSLLLWNRLENDRQMPWKGEKDPYKIWLSEIILQQTRVNQGLNYYQKFIDAFPDIHALANATDSKVFKLWEGLGYYTRCKNLLATARYISKKRKGKFPDTYDEIKQLKGIGPYTAAAISSFAFNLPHAVVDGNVYRVISRCFGITKSSATSEGKKFFNTLANELIDKNQSGTYNQAIMDFGAVVCKPLAPICTECIFKKDCYAFQHGMINELPVKQKKNHIRNRWFNYIVLEYKNQVLIRERTEKDIWQHLFEFPLIETATRQKHETILKSAIQKGLLKKSRFKMISVSRPMKQQLSHQLINGQFIHLDLVKKLSPSGNEKWVEKEKLGAYPFPKFINQYFETGLLIK